MSRIYSTSEMKAYLSMLDEEGKKDLLERQFRLQFRDLMSTFEMLGMAVEDMQKVVENY